MQGNQISNVLEKQQLNYDDDDEDDSDGDNGQTASSKMPNEIEQDIKPGDSWAR